MLKCHSLDLFFFYSYFILVTFTFLCFPVTLRPQSEEVWLKSKPGESYSSWICAFFVSSDFLLPLLLSLFVYSLLILLFTGVFPLLVFSSLGQSATSRRLNLDIEKQTRNQEQQETFNERVTEKRENKRESVQSEEETCPCTGLEKKNSANNSSQRRKVSKTYKKRKRIHTRLPQEYQDSWSSGESRWSTETSVKVESPKEGREGFGSRVSTTQLQSAPPLPVSSTISCEHLN